MADGTWNKPITEDIDWGGDENTGGLPVSGEQVQAWIKETFDKKASIFYLDERTSKYLIFASEKARDAYLADRTQTSLLLGSFEVVSNYTALIDLVDTNPSNYVALGSTGNYIKAYFDIQNKSEASTGESVTATLTVTNGRTTQTDTRQVAFGVLYSINIDDLLSEGTNIVTLNIVGNSSGASTSIGLTYQVLSLELSDFFNISEIHDGSATDSLAVEFKISGSSIKYLEWYLDNEKLEFDATVDTISAVSTERTKYIPLEGLSEGRHNIQYRAYIETADGNKFYSDVLYRDFIIYSNVTIRTAIATAFTIPAEYGIQDALTSPLSLPGITQYITKDIQYAIYNPIGSAVNTLVIIFEGTKQSFSVENGSVYTYAIKPYNAGPAALQLEINSQSLTFNADITPSSLDLEPIDDVVFAFSGTEKTNESLDRDQWSYGEYVGKFSGFNWNENSGWTPNGLLLNNGAEFSVNYAPLKVNPTSVGLTAEFEFETLHVMDDNAVICDLTYEGVGIKITSSEASFTSQGGVTVMSKYKSGENIRISFVINRVAGVQNKSLVFIYVNGVITGAVPYGSSDSFASSKELSFRGSNEVYVLLKQVRVYQRALSFNEIVNNYILYRDTIEEMLAAYDKNDIYEEGTENLSVDKLAAQTPIIIVTGNIEELQQATDKGHEVLMKKVEFIQNANDPLLNAVLTDPIMRPQGTSSMSYPKKNFRIYSQRGADTKLYDYKGDLVPDRLYSFKGKAQPVKTWCCKADYAESSSTHNTGTTRLFNEIWKNARIDNVDPRYYRDTEYPIRTIAQQAAIDNNYQYDVRTCIDGMPIVMFYHLNEEDPLIFLGKYNWNNDKSTESVFGFKGIPGFNNKNMQCWEIKNNGNKIALYTDISNWDEDWNSAYESRYPDDDGKASANERAQGALKTVTFWVHEFLGAVEWEGDKLVIKDAERMRRFSNEKWQRLDVYKMAAYYIYLMRHGAVDQVVKNAMWTTEDAQHWFFILYDCDTILGVRNDGLLKFGYDIDRSSKDPSDPSSYAYAGHESVLWNMLEADEDFMNIVRVVDAALINAGMTYNAAIEMYNVKQSAQWSERLYNIDAQFKYLDPWNDSNNNQLEKLQGARTSHRQWWLSNRYARIDAMNLVGNYKNNNIEIKPTNAGAVSQKIYITPSSEGQIYGFGINDLAVETGVVGHLNEPIEFITPANYELVIGDPVRFYNAAFFKIFDCSQMQPYIQEVTFSNMNSVAQLSALDEAILGREDAQNETLSQLGSISYATYLRKLNVINYKALESLDLSNNRYLEELDARGCTSLTDIAFPSSSPIKSLQLSSALQALKLEDLVYLTDFSIEDYGRNLNTISVKGCDIFKYSPQFLYDWMEARGRVSGDIKTIVELDGIEWTDVQAHRLIALGEYCDSIVLKGKITLDMINEEYANKLVEIFGSYIFTGEGDLVISAPPVIILTGPTEIMEGEMATYVAAKFPVIQGDKPTYQLLDSTVEIVDGVTYFVSGNAKINSITGQLYTTVSLTENREIVVRVSYNDVVLDQSVLIISHTYPQEVTVRGITNIGIPGTYPYELSFRPEEFNGKIVGSTWWTESELVEIKNQTNLTCDLFVPELNSDNIIDFYCDILFENGYTMQARKAVNLSPSKLIVNATSNQVNDSSVQNLPYQLLYDGAYHSGYFTGQTYAVPASTEITIVFGNLTGYKTPDPIVFKTESGTVVKSGQYRTEVVSITCSASNGDNLANAGVKVKVNDMIKAYAGSPLEFKIALGSSYTVQGIGTVGYKTTEISVYTANTVSHSIDLMFEYVLPVELTIVDIDKDTYTLEEWQSLGFPKNRAVGIKLSSELRTFCLHKVGAVGYSWSPDESKLVPGVTTTSNQGEAKIDFYGESNTDALLAAARDGVITSAPAAEWTQSLNYPEGLIGYLASLGNLQIIYDNKDKLNEILQVIGGTKIEDGFYWSSTQFNEYYAWGFNLGIGSVTFAGKASVGAYVRALFDID